MVCWHFNLKFQADIDLHKRAGELSEEEVEKIVTIMQNPRQYKIPNWFLNRQKDIKDGKIYVQFFGHWSSQIISRCNNFHRHFYLAEIVQVQNDPGVLLGIRLQMSFWRIFFNYVDDKNV